MKKGEIYEGIVEKTEFPNRGIIRAEDRRIIIKNTLPGQKIRYRLKKLRKGTGEGQLLEVLEPSPLEVSPACPHFGQCGGCTYQNLPYEEQIRLKEGQLRELLDGAIEKPYVFEGVKESPRRFAYRNKMEFSFGDEVKDGPLALGMHKRGGFYDIVTTDQCQIVDEDYRKILTCTLQYFQEKGLPFYHRLRHTGYLRHLLVRKGAKTGEILVDLVTTTQLEEEKASVLQARLEGEQNENQGESQGVNRVQASSSDGAMEEKKADGEQRLPGGTGSESSQIQETDAAWAEQLRALKLEGEIVGILHTYNDSLADVVQNDRTEILWGRDYFYEELLGLRFKISPFSFFQTNSLGAEVLYSTARDYIGETKDKVIFDLYSGTGTIAQILAPVAQKVAGVEIVEEAVEAARVNAQLNGLENCSFLAGDVLKVIDELQDKPDLIVLDPPRDGIHPKALQKIIDFGVERIVYISCKPTSLVRDLEMLQGRGYQVVKAVGVDMFPGTGHVETVVLLSKGEIDSKKVRVEFSLEGMDMSGFQKGTTYEQIKAYVLEHTGLKVSHLYIAQVKQKHGIIERECYNKPKSEDAKQPQCPPEKEAAIEAALKHFKMI